MTFKIYLWRLGTRKFPVSLLSCHMTHVTCHGFPFLKIFSRYLRFFAIPGCQMRSEHSEHLEKGEISVSNGVATIKHFRWSCFRMTRFISAWFSCTPANDRFYFRPESKNFDHSDLYPLYFTQFRHGQGHDIKMTSFFEGDNDTFWRTKLIFGQLANGLFLFCCFSMERNQLWFPGNHEQYLPSMQNYYLDYL